MSSSKKIRARTVTKPLSESGRRTTRLSSRVSELDARVTIFEPGTMSGVDSTSFKEEVEEIEIEGKKHDARGSLSDDSDEETTKKRPRKRVKMESADIQDLEDLADTRCRSPMQSSLRKYVKAEMEHEEEDYAHTSGTKRRSSTRMPSFPSSSSALPPKSKSPSKSKPIPQSLDKPHPPPANWRETYDTIKAMRSRFVAPVDTMGCAQAQTGETETRNRRYATLVSLMLSSQTKDEVTTTAITNLRAAFGGSISLEAMIEADEKVIADAICKVGFWRRKTGYLKQAALKLRDDFGSDVPKTVDEICCLPGVGPKMAFLTLQIAWELNHGIGVDIHVHRITNLLGWHKPPTKNPEQTRLNLQSWLPKDLHYDINHLLVGFGQVICLPVGPRCDVCDLSAKNLCPSARKVIKVTKNRKEIVFLNDLAEDGNGEPGPKVEVLLEEEDEEVAPI